MKRYEARTFGMVFVWEDGKRHELDPHLELRHFSSGGFAWGCDWLAADQLAYALLYDVLHDDERAVRLHERFAQRAIYPMNRDAPFVMTLDQVLEHVEAIEKESRP